METTLNNLSGRSESGGDEPIGTRSAGLYETGTNNMVASWDELIANGIVVVNDGALYVGAKLPDNLPEKNEYGFYFGVPYAYSPDDVMTFYPDGSLDEFYNGESNNYPAGSVEYTAGGLYIQMWSWSLNVTDDGTTIVNEDGYEYSIAQRPYDIAGDLVLTDDNSVTSINSGAFAAQTSLTSITIPDGVADIGEYAFGGCISLKSVEIPDSVTNVGFCAFMACSSLTDIDVSNNNTAYQSIDGNLYSKDGQMLIQYAIGKTTTEFSIPDGVALIESYAFDGCSNLTSVTIPESVTSINWGAFRNCSSLTRVVIPENVTIIDSEMFASCSSLTEVVLPSNLDTIKSNAFDGCSSLTSIEIPDSVTYIANWAFGNCTGLSSIVIPDSVVYIDYHVFSGCSSLTSIVIGSGVKRLGLEWAPFDGCTSLATIEFRGTVAQWNSINKVSNWNADCPATYVQCSDGQVAI